MKSPRLVDAEQRSASLAAWVPRIGFYLGTRPVFLRSLLANFFGSTNCSLRRKGNRVSILVFLSSDAGPAPPFTLPQQPRAANPAATLSIQHGISELVELISVPGCSGSMADKAGAEIHCISFAERCVHCSTIPMLALQGLCWSPCQFFQRRS